MIFILPPYFLLDILLGMSPPLNVIASPDEYRDVAIDPKGRCEAKPWQPPDK